MQPSRAVPYPWLRQAGLSVVGPENALLCLQCQSALPVKSVDVFRHLRQGHGSNGPYHDLVAAQLDSLTLIDVANLKPRDDGSPAQPGLATTPGYACQRCPFRTSSEQLLSRHLPAIHQVRWKEAREGADYDQVSLQRWAGGGPNLGRWWIVHPERNTVISLADAKRSVRVGRRARTAKPSVQQEERSARVRSQLQAAPTKQDLPPLLAHVLEEEQRCRRDLEGMSRPGVTDVSLINSWLRRTGWDETYRRSRRDVLLRLTQLPTRQSRISGLSLSHSFDQQVQSSVVDERKITVILRGVDQVFDRCEETVGRTSRSTLSWLRSGQHAEPYRYPFQLVGRPSSRQKYRSRWKQCLVMLLRVVRQPDTFIRHVGGVPLTPEQNQVLCQIWGIADAHISAQLDQDSEDLEQVKDEQDLCNSSDDDSDYDSDDSDDSDSNSDKGRSESHHDDTWNSKDVAVQTTKVSVPASIPAAEAELLVPLLTGDVGEYISQLLFRLSVLLITEEFRDGNPASSTLIFLSGVLSFTPPDMAYRSPRNYTPIISALIYSHRLLFLEYVLPGQAYRYLGWPARPPQGHLAVLQRARQQFMCFGCESSYGELSSLLAYGCKLLRSDGPAFFVRWSDDGQTLFFDEQRLHLTQFQTYIHHIVAQAVTQCEDLMLGWNPDVPLHAVRDHFTNLSTGYSFVSEPANRLHDAYTHLVTRLCTTGPQSLMSHNAWHHTSVFTYLRRHESFLASLMLVLYLLGGQIPRCIDLCSLEVRNSEINPRGIFVYKGRMMYVIKHHKARRSTNHEFYVARYLPSCVSRPLYHYLVYIRPTVETLLRQCFKAPQLSSLLFSTNMIVAGRPSHRHWTSRDLSQALYQSSHNILEFRPGAQLCRQLTIAMTEKHVRAAMLFNRHNDRSPEATVDVILAWQSGHRPWQRATTYGLDGAFPHQLQPHLLDLYAQVSDHWHQFLSLSATVNVPGTSLKPIQFPIQGVKTVLPDHGRRQPLFTLSQATTSSITVQLSTNSSDRSPAIAYQDKENIDPERNIQRPKQVLRAAPSIAMSRLSTVKERAPSSAQYSTAVQSPGNHPPAVIKQFTFNSVFVHLPQHRIIVCYRCPIPYAVPPVHVKGHLTSHHPFIPVTARKMIVRHVEQILTLARQPQDVVYPRPWDEPVDGLPVYKDSYRCLAPDLDGKPCLKMLRTLGSVQAHCSKQHGWVNQQGRGGNVQLKHKQTPNRLWQDGQYCQVFFQVGEWKRCFQVQSRLTRCSATDQ